MMSQTHESLPTFQPCQAFNTAPVDNDYEVGAMFCRGAQGAVFTCTHRRTKQACAAKLMLDNREARSEIAAWAQCQHHPHILPLCAVYENALQLHSALLSECMRHPAHPFVDIPQQMLGGMRFLVAIMPMMGGDLFTLFATEAPVRDDLALALTDQIASALSHIHACGYIHGDIKIENILLESADAINALPHVRVCDFGFARRIGEPPERNFTISYLSPEAVQSFFGPPERGQGLVPCDSESPAMAGSGQVAMSRFYPYFGESADTWALGVVVYIALTGKRPFDTSDARSSNQHLSPALHHAICNGSCDFGSRVWTHVTPNMHGIVRGLLTAKPGDRWDLARLLMHLAFTSPSPSDSGLSGDDEDCWGVLS